VVGHLRLAEEFQSRLETGAATTRTALARQYRLTKPRVTQLMELLHLHPDILAYVRNLPSSTPERLVTERKLRRLVKLPLPRQVSEAVKSLPGFAAHRAQRKTAG